MLTRTPRRGTRSDFGRSHSLLLGRRLGTALPGTAGGKPAGSTTHLRTNLSSRARDPNQGGHGKDAWPSSPTFRPGTAPKIPYTPRSGFPRAPTVKHSLSKTTTPAAGCGAHSHPGAARGVQRLGVEYTPIRWGVEHTPAPWRPAWSTLPWDGAARRPMCFCSHDHTSHTGNHAQRKNTLEQT